MRKILLIDDDSSLLESHSRLLSARLSDLELYTASSVSQGLARFNEKKPQAVIMDLSLDDVAGVESGYSLLAEIRKIDSFVPIVVLTGHGDKKYGIRAIGEGANHFLEKPVDIEHLSVILTEVFRQVEFRALYEEIQGQQKSAICRRLVGESKLMQEVRETVAYAASHDLPVLITGETGTGKGLCARSIHELSARASANFVRYQPASSAGDLIRSELFGHKKGSFTGAEFDRAGLIEKAQGGTLFLDEIDAFPLETQVLLLGVLQEKKYRPVGEDAEKFVDFRLVCATNADLEQALQAGSFRKDFYHRISHMTIELPALRKRKEDIPALVESFLEELRNNSQLLVSRVDDVALAHLMQHDWPGNVRELSAVIENSAHRANYHRRDCVTVGDLNLKTHSTAGDSVDIPENEMSFHEQIAQFKKQLVLKELEKHGGNQAQTARMLGIDRSTLIRTIK